MNFRSYHFFFYHIEISLCGNDDSVISPNDNCLKYLWKKAGCEERALNIMESWRILPIKTVFNEMSLIRNNSWHNKFNSNGVYFRYMCFGATSVSKYNRVYRRSVWTNGEIKDVELYNEANAIDGITVSDISLGSCTVIVKVKSYLVLKVHTKEYFIPRKVRIWPSSLKC